MLEKMLFCIPKELHGEEALQQCLAEHPEIKFISLVGIDIYGHVTDEKIPVSLVMSDYENFFKHGVQTDGSSVLLPGIADLSNARVDMIPDTESNWYVDHNFDNLDERTGLPVGTLRIPAYLIHDYTNEVGSRVILRNCQEVFKKQLLEALDAHPYIFKYLPFDSTDDIDEVLLTSATEMEFYVMTPHDVADRERMHTSQEMKEQYWKRVVGPVRTALEKTLEILDCYGFHVEMGHKEVGGVKETLTKEGYNHIMEQLEIDWKYDTPMGAADKDNLARNVIKDTFRRYGLDVSFLAKPVNGVAGSGKHTHLGAAVRLKNGKKVNIFTAIDQENHFMSPVGFGAIMGLLKNYEVLNPLVSATTDAFNRLKPGYEAPICIVTSLGRSLAETSRNRTVLIGLVRDKNNPLATRFEMRSPNPKSNSYLVMGGAFLAMIDGIKAVLEAEKTPEELCASISKEYGVEDFYLEKDRVYRVENNIFKDYTPEVREKLFGKTPATVYENLQNLERYPEKTAILYNGDAITKQMLDSYVEATTDLWKLDIHDRIIPGLEGTVAQDKLEALASALEAERYAEASDMLKEILA